MRPMKSSILAIFVGAIALCGQAVQKPDQTIWSGKSGGLTIAWTTADITATQGGNSVFSAHDWAQTGLNHFVSVSRTAATPSPPDCNYTRTLKIVAVVRAMVSFEDATEITCRKEAHPGGMTRLITLDLSSREPIVESGPDAIGQVDAKRPGKAVLLTRLFPADDVFKALSATAPIQSAVRASGSEPRTLAALIQAVGDATGEGDNCYIIPTDLLAHFAFDRVEGGRVVIRLGLPGDGPCRMKLTSFDTSFAIPSGIASALEAASAGKEGFLAKEGARIAAGRVTTIRLRSGASAK